MVHNWALNLANAIGKELNLENQKLPILSYGLEVLIGAVIRIFIYIAIPYMLGILDLFWAAFFSMGILKLASGGVHSNAYYKCLWFSLILLCVIAFMATHLATFELPLDEITITILIITFFTFLKLAPVTVKEKPIRSEKRRIRLKLIACGLVLVYGASYYLWQPADAVLIACLLSIAFHDFTLTKAGHQFMRYVDGLI